MKYQKVKASATMPAIPPTTPPTIAPVFDEEDEEDVGAGVAGPDTAPAVAVVGEGVEDALVEACSTACPFTTLPFTMDTPFPSAQHLFGSAPVAQQRLPSAHDVRGTKLSA